MNCCALNQQWTREVILKNVNANDADSADVSVFVSLTLQVLIYFIIPTIELTSNKIYMKKVFLSLLILVSPFVAAAQKIEDVKPGIVVSC